jgi:hypothetical protein
MIFGIRMGVVTTKMQDGDEEVILHDNIADPNQLENVANDHPNLVAELREEMNGWLEKNRDPWLT